MFAALWTGPTFLVSVSAVRILTRPATVILC